MNADVIERVEKRGIEAYVAISDEEQNVRRYDYRPPGERKLLLRRAGSAGNDSLGRIVYTL